MPAEADPDMTLPGNRRFTRSKTVLTPAMVVEVTRQSATSGQSALNLKTTTEAKTASMWADHLLEYHVEENHCASGT